MFEQAKRTRLITAESAVETLAMFAACLAFAEIMDGFDKEYLFDLPKFVWCLFGGVVIRNILTAAFKVNMFDRAIDVFGNASLSLFLAMALLNLKLWELTGLAGPVTVILAVQTVVMVLYATLLPISLWGATMMRQYWLPTIAVSAWVQRRRRWQICSPSRILSARRIRRF